MSRPLKFKAVVRKAVGGLHVGEWVHFGIFNAPAMGVIDLDTLVQFTGLYDVNKVEIYEGDIVMVINYLNGKPWEGHIHPCEVRFTCGRFDLKNAWSGETLSDSSVEVIGNIHEESGAIEMNPQLIHLYKMRRAEQRTPGWYESFGRGQHAVMALASARLGLRIRQRVAQSNHGAMKPRRR